MKNPLARNTAADAKSGEIIPPTDGEPTKTNLPDTVSKMEDTTKGTGVARAGATAVSAEVADEFDTGTKATGLENVTSRDLLIPRLTILQDLSPQVKKNKPEYIEGAEIGDFCDTAVGEVYKELLLIPVYYATILLEWAPRATGKGLVANHGMSREILKDCTQDEKRRYMHGDNLVSETMTFYALNVTAGGRRCFVPLSSTALKSGRKWLTLITNERVLNPRTNKEFQPPIFYRSWKASATEETNNQGSWFGWKFESGQTILEIDPDKNLLAEAKDFMEQARSGLVSGDLASYADDGTAQGMQEQGEGGSKDERAM